MRFPIILLLLLLLPGCGNPNKANVHLRRERDQHLAEIESLRQQLAADRARLQALETGHGTLQTLPQARLDTLYTTHDISLGRQTGGADLDPSKPGDEALKIYLMPVDESGDPLKTTGNVTIDLFNLDRPTDALVAQWQLTPDQLKPLWHAMGPLHHFILTFPLPKPPPQPNLHLRITFTDQLTGRMFTKTLPVTFQLPPPPPATQASVRQ